MHVLGQAAAMAGGAAAAGCVVLLVDRPPQTPCAGRAPRCRAHVAWPSRAPVLGVLLLLQSM
jgi:hypothetical protein